jgi:hypothetical protein
MDRCLLGCCQLIIFSSSMVGVSSGPSLPPSCVVSGSQRTTLAAMCGLTKYGQQTASATSQYPLSDCEKCGKLPCSERWMYSMLGPHSSIHWCF